MIPTSTAVITAISFLGSSILHIQALNLTDNEYTKGETPNRSPCPGINTLANHGFINRNGTNIHSTDLVEAMEEVYGVDTSFSLGVLTAHINNGLAVVENGDGTYMIDLFNWYNPAFDHDASLVRMDPSETDPLPQFSPELFAELESLSEDGKTITKEMLAEHQQNRIKYTRANTPDPSIPVNVCGAQATLAMDFGHDESLETASLAMLESHWNGHAHADERAWTHRCTNGFGGSELSLSLCRLRFGDVDLCHQLLLIE